MDRPPIGLVSDPSYQLHFMGEGHPERPERLRVLDAMVAGLDQGRFERLTSAPAIDTAFLEAVHSAGHVQRIRDACARGPAALDPDTAVVPASWQAALKAAGGVLEACRRVAAGRWQRAFCLVRPPGHHAEPSRAMGFCLFNNVAVAARALQDEGWAKIAIVDFDGHHGNGTQEAFWDDPTVFYASSHQSPAYPGTGAREERGAGPGLDFTLNRPLPPGSGDEVLLPWIEGELSAALRRFKPDFLLLSAGFDAHERDPLLQLAVSTEGFSRLSAALVALADDCCGGRLVSALEGGYDLHSLTEAAAAHLEALAG